MCSRMCSVPPDNGSIEFCKKRPSMVLQFGDRLSAVAGSPLGLISLKIRERLTLHTKKCSWKSVETIRLEKFEHGILISTRQASQKTWLKGVVGRRGRKAWSEDVAARRGRKAWPEGVSGKRGLKTCLFSRVVKNSNFLPKQCHKHMRQRIQHS